MALQFTSACPVDVDLQDACGVPLAVVAQPLARPDDAPAGAAAAATCWAADLARCSRCLAYINSLCDVDARGWECSLCGCGNDFSSATSLRRYYSAGPERRAQLPELQSAAVDAVCPLVTADADEGVEEVVQLEAQPAVLALVDVACGEEALDLVKSSLAAAVEALPPAARFGLVTFGSQVGLHLIDDTFCSRGMVQHVPLGGPGQPPLQEVAPLGHVMASVGSGRQAILAAVEALEGEPTVGGGRTRPLGDAVRAVLRWVATGGQQAAAEGLAHQQEQAQQQQEQQEQQQGGEGADGGQQQAQQQDGGGDAGGGGGNQGSSANSSLPAAATGFPGLRLLLFLSGPPNTGPGAVVVVRPAAVDPVAAAKADEEAAQEAARDLASLMLDPVYPELSAWSDVAARSSAQRQQQAVVAAAAAAATALVGDLSHASPPGVPPHELQVNVRAAQFYAEAGAAAAALSVSVDIFAACPQWVGLELLEPLASSSGGCMLLYSSLEHAPMPQDVYKSVTQPRAFACLLRLRCSPELQIGGHHGRLMVDSQHSDLFHAVGCGPEDAFAFDLDRTTRRATCAAAAVQLVLQYSVVLPAAAHHQDGANGKAAPPGSRFVLHRRMRIITAALPLASTPEQLYSSCDADATTCLAVHKALATAAELGAEAAQRMLFDWLVLLAGRVAELGRKNKVDASLSDYESLQHLPHMLYALLHGPLLQDLLLTPAQQPAAHREEGPWRQHPDSAAAMRALAAVLPPEELAVAVCPHLSSWATPDDVAGVQHSLSAAALALSQQPIWVLDTFWQLVVLGRGTAGGGGSTPFPPPAASLLRRTMAGIRKVRRCTPEVLMLREGVDDTAAFTAWLIEDAQAAPAATSAPAAMVMAAAQQGGGNGKGGLQQGQAQQGQRSTFVTFLDAVARQSEEMLRNEREDQ